MVQGISLSSSGLNLSLIHTCGEWDILLLNLTSIGFTNFFRCLIFDLFFFTNADFVTIKDEASKENS